MKLNLSFEIAPLSHKSDRLMIEQHECICMADFKITCNALGKWMKENLYIKDFSVVMIDDENEISRKNLLKNKSFVNSICRELHFRCTSADIPPQLYYSTNISYHEMMASFCLYRYIYEESMLLFNMQELMNNGFDLIDSLVLVHSLNLAIDSLEYTKPKWYAGGHHMCYPDVNRNSFLHWKNNIKTDNIMNNFNPNAEGAFDYKNLFTSHEGLNYEDRLSFWNKLNIADPIEKIKEYNEYINTF